MRTTVLALGAYAASVLISKTWYLVVGVGSVGGGAAPSLGQPVDAAAVAEAFVARALFIPLTEEAIFRRHLFDLVLPILGRLGAVIATAVAFGAGHLLSGLGWRGAGDLFLFGLIAGALRLRTGGIALSTIVHGLHNAVLVLALLPMG